METNSGLFAEKFKMRSDARKVLDRVWERLYQDGLDDVWRMGGEPEIRDINNNRTWAARVAIAECYRKLYEKLEEPKTETHIAERIDELGDVAWG